MRVMIPLTDETQGSKVEKFVEENEVKRRRALKKFQMERQQNEVKEKEKEELSKQLQDLQARSPSQTPAEKHKYSQVL